MKALIRTLNGIFISAALALTYALAIGISAAMLRLARAFRPRPGRPAWGEPEPLPEDFTSPY